MSDGPKDAPGYASTAINALHEHSATFEDAWRRAVAERDEAREVARELHFAGSPDRRAYREQYPWLAAKVDDPTE